VLADVLAARGNAALVFHGDGLDELTTTGPSTVWVVSNGTVVRAELDPLAVGVPRSTLDDLRGGDPARNGAIARAVLAGEPGPVRDIVLLNAAAAVAASEGLGFVTSAGPAGSRADGTSDPGIGSEHGIGSDQGIGEDLAKALSAGIARAAEAVDSGAAARLLARWAQASQRLAAR
jgi:anthranilate phosphoribosyltransferase